MAKIINVQGLSENMVLIVYLSYPTQALSPTKPPGKHLSPFHSSPMKTQDF